MERGSHGETKVVVGEEDTLSFLSYVESSYICI